MGTCAVCPLVKTALEVSAVAAAAPSTRKLTGLTGDRVTGFSAANRRKRSKIHEIPGLQNRSRVDGLAPVNTAAGRDDVHAPSTLRQTRGYLPSRRTSPLFDRYQCIPLRDGGTIDVKKRFLRF